MSAPDFVHLRLHSEFSVGDGIARLAGGEETVLDVAARERMGALAISDLGNLFGAIKFYRGCVARGIKPIIGCDMWVEAAGAGAPSLRALFLCQNDRGYRNLCALLTRAYRDNRRGGRAAIDPDWLDSESAAGLIVLSGGRDSDIGRRLLAGDDRRARDAAEQWAKRFPDRFYLEASRAGFADGDELAAGAADLARRLGLPLAATHPIQFLRRDDFEAHEARVCIAEGQLLDDKERASAYTAEQYFKSAAEMAAAFADIPEASANTVEIARRCNFRFELGKIRLPAIRPPAGETAAAYLARRADEGLRARLNRLFADPGERAEAFASRYEPRLQSELKVVADTGFGDYFLIVAEFVAWAKARGIPVAPGRGSGGGSLCAFALGITDVDPIYYGLLFERFLNAERVELPDFDIDFCQDERDAVIRHVRETYGEDCVAQIVTFGTLGAKAAVRDVGRVLGMAYDRCDKLARMIPNDLKITLAKARANNPELDQTVKNEEEVTRLFALASKVEGLPRNIGTHAAGVLIAPERLDQFCPLYAAADSGGLVSQFDMDDVKEIGLVKFDFLGLNTLTILNGALERLRESGAVSESFTWDDIPPDDPAVYKIYADGDTVGIFQCESGGMREMMQRLAPDRFDDIVALMGLYRPGPLESGATEDYIERKHKRMAVEYPHPSLAPALAATYGTVLYQEQVMQIAQIIAGYSLGEADILRKAMGKKEEELFAAQKDRFISGAVGKLSAGKAKALFDALKKFSGYGFNKAHSTAYALISYRTAWCKAHHPAAFLASAMSCEMRNTDGIAALIRDGTKRGIETLPPDINRDAARFRALDERRIAYGVAALKGVGDAAAREIVAARDQGGAFTDLFDFCKRAAGGMVNSRSIEALIKSGAFRSIEQNRAALLETLPAALRYAEHAREYANQNALFSAGADGDGGAPAPMPAMAARAPWSAEETLLAERAALGFSLSGHFFDLFADVLRGLPERRPLADIGAGSEGEKVTVAGILDSISSSRAMRRMGFEILRLDDKTEIVEIRAERERVRALGEPRCGTRLLIVRGKIARNYRGEIGLRADEILDVDDWLERVRRIRLSCRGGDGVAEKLIQALSIYRDGGKTEVLIDYRNGAARCTIALGEQWRVRADSKCLRAAARALGGEFSVEF